MSVSWIGCQKARGPHGLGSFITFPQGSARYQIMVCIGIGNGRDIFAVLAIGSWQDNESNEAILTELQSIEVNCAMLQRNVLRAHAGLLRNYHPLIVPLGRMRTSVADLQQL